MDSGFALAYTGLSDASMLMYREKKDRFWSERGIAVAKSGGTPEPQTARGTSVAGKARTAQRANPEAITELKKALELFAEFGFETYRRLGLAYADVGHTIRLFKL